MLLCSIFLLALVFVVGSAAAGDNPSTLWDQALQYHGWPTVHSKTMPNVQCHQMRNNSTNTELHRTGFHGKVTYTVQLPQAVASDTCKFTVLQLLPAGVYADPYELQNLVTTNTQKEGGRLLSVKVFGLVDVEKIETDCGHTLLSVSAQCVAAQMQVVSHHGDMQMKLTVPLHARYPAPQKCRASGLFTFLFSGLHHYNMTPSLLRVEHANKADSNPSPQCYSGQAQHSLHWTVPTGGMWHMRLVEIVTTLTAVSSLCVLLRTIHHGNTVYVKQS